MKRISHYLSGTSDVSLIYWDDAQCLVSGILILILLEMLAVGGQ